MADSSLPRWDMTRIYPGLDSPEFEAELSAMRTALDELEWLFDHHQVSGETEPASLDYAGQRAFERLFEAYNAAQLRFRPVNLYVNAFIYTDAANERAQVRARELQAFDARLELLTARLTAWVGALDVEALIQGSTLAQEHTFWLRRMRRLALRRMPPDQEALAAELSFSGSVAWRVLWESVTGQMRVPVALDGQPSELPMSQVRRLAYDPNRDTRRQAYEAELAAWQQAAEPLAAALNGIKGEQVTLTRRRGWSTPLEAALEENAIDRPVLDAMLEAISEALPDLRRYLRAKAQHLGLPILAWYDLYAPMSASTQPWPFEAAAKFITEQFGTHWPRLGHLAARAFQDGWIDAEPRPGKLDFSACARLRADESLVIVNYRPVFFEVTTLAHELGHAYHHFAFAHRSFVQQQPPPTLSETASTICEVIIREAGLAQAQPEEKVAILEAWLQSVVRAIAEGTNWYLFEKDLFETRQERALTVEELKALRLEKQRQIYGEGLDADTLHPFTWAAWSHLFGRPFDNFKYAFGALFALGLYAQYRQQPAGFWERYDDLLSATGTADAVDLASRFDIDLRAPGFWRSSLNLIRSDIHQFEALVAKD